MSGAGRPAPYTRRSATALALVGAVIATLGIVAFLVLVVVRPDGVRRPDVDWRALAAQAQPSAPGALLAPDLPTGWTANAASIETVAGVPTWDIGLLAPDLGFIALKQGFGATEDWLRIELDEREPQDGVTIGGVDWRTIDRRAESDTGNHAFTMVAETGDSTVVLHGTATPEDFRIVAEAVAEQLR